jgi:branched-subunit amino acid permease
LIKEYSAKPFGAGFLNYWGTVDVYAHVMFKAIKKELK